MASSLLALGSSLWGSCHVKEQTQGPCEEACGKELRPPENSWHWFANCPALDKPSHDCSPANNLTLVRDSESGEPRSPPLQVDSLSAEPPGSPKNTGMGGLSFLQWIFLTQESNQGLLYFRWILYQLSYQGIYLSLVTHLCEASCMALVVNDPPAIARDKILWVRSLSQEDPLEEGMATHSNIFAWRIPWTEELRGL